MMFIPSHRRTPETRDQFISGYAQRRRDTEQKMARVAFFSVLLQSFASRMRHSLRRGKWLSLFEAEALYSQEQDRVEYLLREEALWIADYLAPRRSMLDVNISVTGVEDLQRALKQLSSHSLTEVGDRFKAGTMSAGGREPSTTINDAEKM